MVSLLETFAEELDYLLAEKTITGSTAGI